MSQRECAGFNWPESAVAASDPVSTSPEAVNRMGSIESASPRIATSPAELPAELYPLRAGERLVGVGQPASSFAQLSSAPSSVMASRRRVSLRRMPVLGEADSLAAAHRSWGPPFLAISASAPARVRAFFVASAAVGVGHADSIAKSLRFEPWRVAPAARFAWPPPLASLACGLGHDASFAIQDRSTCRFLPSGVRPVGDIWPPFGLRPPFGQVGVGQYAVSFATICRSVSDTPMRAPRATQRCLRARNASGVPFAGCASGVGHEPQPLPDVRRTDARSAEIDRPDGVTRTFQVSVNKVEPVETVAACNLLAKHDARAALRDEVVPRGPKVPLVSKPASAACRAERLARTAARPDRAVVRPAGEAQRVRPDADAGEEVALIIAGEFLWSDITHVPFINVARRDQPHDNQVSEPLRRIRIVLVVPGGHGASSPRLTCARRSRCSGA